MYPLVDDKVQTKVLAQKVGITTPNLIGVVEVQNQVKNLLEMVKGYKEFVVKPAHGSVGKAIRYADNAALASYDDLCKIIYAKNKYKLADLLAFCDAAVADEDSYNLVQELVLKFVAENVKGCENVEELAEMWEKAVRIFDETARLNLDKKQALINIISGICKVI